jgi:acetyltransferase
MSVLNLMQLFAPGSVAVIGASDRPRSVGNIVMRNLLDGQFPGPIMPVNPGRQAVCGVLAYPTIDSLPLAPDLAVICTPGPTLPELIGQLGRRGTKAAIIAAWDADPAKMAEAARPFGLRLLGGNSLGLLVPKSGLNASFAHVSALPGRVAFVSQSGALCMAVLDWAMPRGIGFSHFVSLGDGGDIDFADMMDHLANDEETRAILLYIESIGRRGDFMPAARAAARNKPVVIIKAGRGGAPKPIGPFLAESLAAPDDVFDAVTRRAGCLRVDTLDELFAAVETLARSKMMRGNRIAILSNGGGTAMIALDDIQAVEGATLASLSDDTLAALARTLPEGWAAGNPLDLHIDAPAERYGAALKVLARAPEIDGVLVIHAPNPMVDSVEIARTVVETQRSVGGILYGCWLGGESAAGARRICADAGLPTYDSIGNAVRGIRHLIHYQRNQEMLLETPPMDPGNFQPDRKTARAVIARCLAKRDGFTDDSDGRALLSAYGIPTVQARLAESGEEAARIAAEIGYPVALTVASRDISRKWDVGGVALNLENAEAILAAAEGILRRVGETRPDARIDGFAIQPMVVRPHARQLMIGIACDPVFGPVLVFGEGGRAVEVLRDHTVALPPLNLPLAQQVIDRTRVSRLLEAHGMRLAADRQAIAESLVRLSHLLIENPEIIACDINPLFADENGVIAVDARIRLAPPAASDARRFAILPYPAALEEPASLHDGSAVLLRPIRPEDEPAHAELVGRMTPQDLRFRFLGAQRKLQHHQLARLTQIDYDREMAFIATRIGPEGKPESLGVVRTVTDPDNRQAELSILVRSDLKGTGLGAKLMDKIIRYQKGRGTGEIRVQILAENEAMLRLALKCGFTRQPSEDPDIIECVLKL